MNMNISPIAVALITSIEDYVSVSSKVGYRFTIEEQMELQKQIKILENQINMLIDYELKRENQGE